MCLAIDPASISTEQTALEAEFASHRRVQNDPSRAPLPRRNDPDSDEDSAYYSATDSASENGGAVHIPDHLMPEPLFTNGALPAVNTPAQGLSQTGNGNIQTNSLGIVQDHMLFPLVVQVTPYADETDSFRPVTSDDMWTAMEYYECPDDQVYPELGMCARGWWMRPDGSLWKGDGLVVRVFVDVGGVWVEGMN